MKANVSCYWDSASKHIYQINQRIFASDYEIVSYFYEKGALIKVARDRMIDRSIVSIGEYYFDNGKVILKKEVEVVDPKNIIKTSNELYQKAISLVQEK